MSNDEDILRWPCGTWCYRYEREEFTHLSDDFIVVPFSTLDHYLLTEGPIDGPE